MLRAIRGVHRRVTARVRRGPYKIAVFFYRRVKVFQRVAHKLVLEHLTGSGGLGELHVNPMRRELLAALSRKPHFLAEFLGSSEFGSVLSETASVKTALNTFIQNDSPGAPVIADRTILMALSNRVSQPGEHLIRYELSNWLTQHPEFLAEFLGSSEFGSVLSETASVKTALNTFIQNDSPGAPLIADRSILIALFIRLSAGSNPLGLTSLVKALRIMAAYKALEPHLGKLSLASRHEILAQAASGDNRIEREIFDEVLSGSTVQHFKNGIFKFPDKNSAWVLTNEIFVGQDYFFESSREDPLVIDAGVHAGFAVVFIKSLYPKARIIGFEPDPRMYDLAKENISALQLTQVELLPYALSDKDGFVTFYGAENDSMASSLKERPRPKETYKPRAVEARRLSHWLNEPVEFLKMDI